MRMTDKGNTTESTKPTLRLSLNGLHCNGCSNRVKQSLEALPDVLSATVNEERDRCDIELREVPKDPNLFVRTVESLGFSANHLN